MKACKSKVHQQNQYSKILLRKISKNDYILSYSELDVSTVFIAYNAKSNDI